MPNVAYIHPDVKAKLSQWQKVRDCVEGQEAIKAAGVMYLPKPNAQDKSDANTTRYNQYKERAVFYNVTGRTLRGLVGQVFTVPPVAEVPTLLTEYVDDIDGAGVTFEQQSKKTLEETLAIGRCGLLVDYPMTDGPATQDQLRAGKIRPTVSMYAAHKIINWRSASVGGIRTLALVVLQEEHVTSDDGFEMVTSTQYRVLQLVDGLYVVTIYRDDGSGNYLAAEEYVPKQSNGAPFDFIPFTFVGASNNDWDVDYPPMYDLAALNIAHYRNSADYEESCYITGQPTPYAAGLTQAWVDKNMKDGVYLGSRNLIPLPAGGSMGLIQAQTNTMPFEAMQHKERQMVALGARLAEQKTVQRTATEALQESASEASVLTTVTKNTTAAYQFAFECMALFVGASDSTLKVELNTEFEIAAMTAQERAQLIAEWQAEAISFTEMRSQLRKVGVATQDDQEALDEIGTETPGHGLPAAMGTAQPGGVADPNAQPAAGDAAQPQGGINGQ